MDSCFDILYSSITVEVTTLYFIDFVVLLIVLESPTKPIGGDIPPEFF